MSFLQGEGKKKWMSYLTMILVVAIGVIVGSLFIGQEKYSKDSGKSLGEDTYTKNVLSFGKKRKK